MAKFEWDEDKRQKTLSERGLEFADAEKIFEDDYAFSAHDSRYSDNRWLLIGKLRDDQIVVLAYKEYTARPDTYRIISMRKAEKQEIERYESEKIIRLPLPDDPLIQLLNRLERERERQEEINANKDTHNKRHEDNI